MNTLNMGVCLGCLAWTIAAPTYAARYSIEVLPDPITTAAGINARSLSGLMKYLASPASLDATVTNESVVVSGVPSQGRYIESGESQSE